MRAARGVPQVKKEGLGEGHVKQGENFEGERGIRELAMEQSKPCAPVRPKQPAPRKPYQLTAVAVGHARALPDPCAQRGTQANKSTLDCNIQRAFNTHSTRNETRLTVPVLNGAKPSKIFFLSEEIF